MENKQEVIKKLDSSVLAVIGNTAIQGFEKAHVVSNAINELKTLLTDDYMKPIMALQGNRLGFRTDKDKNGGYPVEVVRNCLIEAVLMGLQPTGNQFNIIVGNTYPTKEGCGYLLNNFPGLKYDLVVSIPRINEQKTGAAVEVTINWTLGNGIKNTKAVPFAIKMDSYTSVDSIVGKATRKGRAWLLSAISGTEITDGDVQDTTFTDVTDTPVTIEDLELQYTVKKSLLTTDEQTNIERIIKNKETQSYKKALAIIEKYK